MRSGTFDDQFIATFTESQYAGHYPLATGQLAQLVAIGIKEIKMIIAVRFGLPDELVRVIRQEEDGLLWLHIAMIAFCDQYRLSLSGLCGIAHQVLLVLLSVQLDEVDASFIGAPGDVGQVFLLGQPRFQPNGLSGR